MEGRPNRGRGGSWRRGGGGGGGNEAGTFEHRGRGRGGRGRGKRDHYRGRGRGGAAASGFHNNRDEGSNLEVEEEEEELVFPRRKLESNWDRYEESEKEAQNDDETPVQRGADFHVLLQSAGDSFTQFRFSEEKEWEMDSLATSQLSAVFVDLAALAQCLQELPLHQRLNLEAELVQVSTPVELPVMTVTAAPKQTAAGSTGMFLRPPGLAPEGPGTSLGLSSAASPLSGTTPQGSSSTAKPPAEDMDEELDQLLVLQRPLSEPSGTSPGSAREEEEEEEEVEEEVEEEEEEEMVRDKSTPEREEPVPEEEGPVPEAPPPAEPVKQDVTEEDLEDWLDSMIS